MREDNKKPEGRRTICSSSYLHKIFHCHYNDVIMDTIAPQITSLKSPALFIQPFIQTPIKENIKAPRHWPLCGEVTGDQWIPAQMASNAENVSIWWRHHGDDRTILPYYVYSRNTWTSRNACIEKGPSIYLPFYINVLYIQCSNDGIIRPSLVSYQWLAYLLTYHVPCQYHFLTS